MKTKSIFFICLTAYSPLVLNNCTEDGDTTKPVIDLHEPVNDAALKIGGTVHLDADFSDNENLASYKVNIHPDFDGHTHETRSFAEESTDDFTYEKTWSISGRDKYVHEHIEIPANATPGDYHLMVYCTDAAGNEAHIAVDVELSHDAAEHDDHDDD